MKWASAMLPVFFNYVCVYLGNEGNKEKQHKKRCCNSDYSV